MGIYAAAIQGVLSIDSGIQQGIADKKQADKNTQLAFEAAADSLQRGETEAGQITEAGSQLAARQMVAFTNSGVDATVGTAADVQNSTVSRAKLAALQVENNAAREAWGYKKHGLAFQEQAAIDSGRRNREIAGGVLSTAGNVVSAYNKTGFGL